VRADIEPVGLDVISRPLSRMSLSPATSAIDAGAGSHDETALNGARAPLAADQ